MKGDLKMKHEKIFLLTVIIFTSATAFAQTEAELTEPGQFARNILLKNGIDRRCFSATNIPQGIFISSRTEANIPVNYLYTSDSQLTKVDILDGHVIIAYSPVSNSLLTGKYEYEKFSDHMYREVYSFNLKTETFTLEYKSRKWILSTPRYNAKYDSIKIDTGDTFMVKLK